MKGIDIKKYPLTYRLCQSLFKEVSGKKSISVTIHHRCIDEIRKNIKLNDKYINNKYIKIINNRKDLINRKTTYVPKNNINLIDIDIQNKTVNYYSYNYIKKNAEIVEKALDSLTTNVLIKFDIAKSLCKNKESLHDIGITYYPFPFRTNTIDKLRMLFFSERNNFFKNEKNIILSKKDNKKVLQSNLANIKLTILSKLINIKSTHPYYILNILIKELPNIIKPETSKIGKAFNKIFIDIKANEIEEIINCILGIYEINISQKERIIELTGDEITEFYNKYKYYKQGRGLMTGGTLGTSCMRYVVCRDRFEFYEKNPDIIKMIVYMSKDFKTIRARALLWDNKYLDRIYFDTDESKNILYSYSKTKKYLNVNSNNGTIDANKIGIKLKEWNFNHYPYLDSFCNIDQTSGNIYNSISTKYNKPTIRPRDYTTGSVTVVCDKILEDKNIVKVKSSYEKQNIPLSQAVYSNVLSSFIHKNKAIYIDGLDDFDHNINFKKYDFCIKIYSGLNENTISFKRYLYPISESVFIDKLKSKVHISNLEFNNKTCEFDLIFPESKSEKNVDRK